MQRRMLGFALAAVAAVTAGCGGDDDGDDTDEPTEEQATEPAGDPGTASVTLDGGPDEGEHAGGPAVVNCTFGVLGDGVFGFEFFDEDAGDGLSSVFGTVEDAEGDGTTDGTVRFGELFTPESREYDLTGATSSVDDVDADNPTVTMEGETADGVSVTATVTCDDYTRG